MKKTATYICIAVLIGVLSPLHLLATNLDNCGGGASPATNIESNGIELTGTQCGELNVNVGTITADIKLYGSSQLTINGDINRIQGSILLENNTTLIINGNINRIESDLVIKQGTVYINGSVTADGKMELSLGGDAIFDGGTFISSGSDIIIKSGSVLDMRNSSEIRVPGSQTITNDGTILTDGSGNTINGTVEGTGTNPAYITYCVGSPCVEAPGFVLIETGGSTEVDEGGATDAFDILLFYKPTGNVTFTLTSSDPTEFTTSATTVTFTPANFDVAQTITVNPVDDAINDNDIVSTMTAAINTLLTSTEYDAVADKTLSVTTIDDEFLPPVATSFTESTSEDVEVFTSLTDLSYSDPDNEPLVSLRIVATPAKGTLFRDTPPYGSFDGTDVVLSNGNTLTNAQLSSSRLGYIPAANEFGTGYASMTYDVYDGREYSTSTYTINFDVASVNDAPAFTTSGNITVNEDFASQQVVSITPDPVPTDETGQTVTYSLAPTSVTFATIGFNTTTGQITFDAIADEFGSQTFTITANDAQTANNTATQNVTFTVNPINDAPSFTAGTNVQVNEDAGATNIAGWASAISKGPANESADILTFNVSNDNPSLFAIAPAVNTSTGDLTFTPVADAFGTATVDIQLRDNGGTISGGVDSTATVSISLGIVSINDAPTFSIADYLVVAINDGAKTVPGFASALSVGNAYEAGQTLTFSVSNNNNVLFATQPSIDPVSGDLSFTTAVDEIGTAQVSVQLQDDGGTANGGTNLSTIQTFDLVVTNPPTLTSVAAGKPEGNEDSEILISFSNLLSDSDAQDLDGTVDAFIVKALAGGTLKIGATSATAAPFSAGINDTISATNNAYWTPETDAFGDPLDAFTVVAMDDKGMTSDMGQSATPAQMVSPKVNAVNDAPSFTKGADQAVGDTHGAQTVNNWATAILAGPINESDQTSSLTFETSNNNNLIFDQQPMLDQAGTLTYAPKAGQSGVATVTVRLNDGGGTSFGGQEYSADQTFTITVEQPPVLTGFTSVVRTTNEDTQSANIRADNHLLPNSDASDPGDITWVNAPVFRVTEVVSGSLIIDGAPFAVGTNDIIRETPRKRAKWTPAADVFGDSVAAFKVVAVAQSGVTSQPPVTAYVQVTSVNDAPEITSFTSPLTSTLTDTEIEITFAEMLAASDASDVDGTVDAFEATLINSGSLKIGSSAGTATTATTFNKTIDNTNNAYWTPATSASGNLPAFTVKAQDDLGVLSTASAVVNVLVGGSPGMTVSAISNNISETGRTATFDVVLDAPPASAVVLDIASTNTAEGTITPTTLTFDNSNWNVSQQVTVTGVDDGVTDADQSLAINVSVNAALSNDAFDTVSAEAVSVTNINAIINSTSNADTVSWTNGSIWQDGLAPAPDHAVIGSDILIGGYVRVYQDSLTSLSNELVFAQNGAEYTLTVDSGAILVVENSLIFQQSATNLVVKEGGRLVVLGNFINDPFHSVVNDGVIAIAENYYQADASVNYSGTGNLYVGGSVTTVGSDADLVDQPIGNLQDGAAHEDAHVYELLMTHLHELLVTETNDSTYVSEIGLVDTLRVQLSAQPASDVVLDLLAADTSETQITPATLTFTNANWNVDQIVRVEGKNDPEIDGNVVSLLTVSVNTTASDSSYQFTAPKSIAVTNEDDDTLPVAIDNAQLVDEDSLLILSKTDFTFSDADGDTLVKVKIVSLPVEGLLFRDVAPKNGQYDTGEEVLGNDEILVQEIIAGQLIYQTPANTFGSPADSLVFQVQDEFYFSNSAKLVININGVNDAPSFTKGADQVVNEDTTAITVSNWATSISAGPGETEAVTFDVSNDSSALFSVQPAIASNGTLTYTPAANAYGSATVSVILNDGQAANNLSTTETFTITINAINDAPSYTKGADQVVNEDTTAITITNWATSISAGPGESEAVTFDVSNDSSALFSSQPSIAANGTLTFT
ncbi:beta strand repeat-containing protein, partial [Marinoscillum furvescens]|uniref:beta strand repeat-containing protein n=1 Tax=Marinoscillum furvescens TaxID=1026 RepID=UPI0014755301